LAIHYFIVFQRSERVGGYSSTDIKLVPATVKFVVFY